MKILFHISRTPKNRKIGNKARGLKKLISHHFSVPNTWVIPADVEIKITSGKEDAYHILMQELEQFDSKKSYAVRSSGVTEDGTAHSFAGQFKSLLDIQGPDSLYKAIREVWSSGEASKIHAYRGQNFGRQDTGMAVIIQEMVESEWSGVGFSIHPVTGRNELIIEGIPGKADKLVQGGAAPQRWTWHQSTWEPFDREKAPPLEVLEELSLAIQKMRSLFKAEVDVEWAWDGNRLYYLQCRPITGTRYPTIYSNHISREVLPGMIKPLIWSVNIPLVNGAWIRLLEEILGPLGIKPGQLSKSFYYRAYFNMGTLGSIFKLMGLPVDSLESLMGRKDPSGKSSFRPGLKTIRFLPGMIRFMFSLPGLGKRFRKEIKIISENTQEIIYKFEHFQAEDYRVRYKEIHDLASIAAYWNIIVPLAMQISSKMLERKMKRQGREIKIPGYHKDFPQLLDYDPQYAIISLQNKWKDIPENLRQSVVHFEDLSKGHVPELEIISEGIHEIMEEYGHFSESGNDFSYPPWREDPDFILSLVKNVSNTERGNGKNEKDWMGKNIKKSRAYRRAGQYRLYREMISSEYTRCYGLFRVLFLHTGNILVQRDILSEPGDVFYLSLEKHDRLLEDPAYASSFDAKEKVARIKKEMKEQDDLNLPSIIYGEEPPPLASEDIQLLDGIPVSPGIFEGEVVVIKGYADFKKPVEGKILVIPFSDVGWTPILVKAGAIVSESGGVLSHASIVAREMSIPAITSVENACKLVDNTSGRVDGHHGKLTIQKS